MLFHLNGLQMGRVRMLMKHGFETDPTRFGNSQMRMGGWVAKSATPIPTPYPTRALSLPKLTPRQDPERGRAAASHLNPPPSSSPPSGPAAAAAAHLRSATDTDASGSPQFGDDRRKGRNSIST
ncbi:hypothetical protein MUK42_37657 [Musa troglodytarum]|uniref:Uncharacterized protein n=1 Tax=Musa troglodytarum TaxID=320322 RepID=A0A9E7FM96_9LILI|nr:hypothetical protein MUK42_37657 [Musa troglodytarum]